MNMINNPIPRPGEHVALWQQMVQLAFESQMVITLRVAGMCGLLPQAPEETTRMVLEKTNAVQDSFVAVMGATLRGDRYDQVAFAAIRPYGQRTNANARRLSRHLWN